MTMHDTVFHTTYTIRAYELDIHGRLSAAALCNILQDSAGRHAHQMGVAVFDLLEDNFTWVLSRLRFRMERWPGWGDTLNIETGPTGMDRLFAYRDFRLTSEKEGPLGVAQSAWVVINASKRTPVRATDILGNMELMEPVGGDPAGLLKKLPRFESGSDMHEELFRVRFDDLDVNRHVNNVSYIVWALEGIPFDVHESATLTGLDINFLAEAFHGERIVSHCAAVEDTSLEYRHAIVREEDGRDLARARTVWRNDS